MMKVKALDANGNRVVCEYTPLTDPARALKYADLLSNRYNDVVVTHVRKNITVTARNVWK